MGLTLLVHIQKFAPEHILQNNGNNQFTQSERPAN